MVTFLPHFSNTILPTVHANVVYMLFFNAVFVAVEVFLVVLLMIFLKYLCELLEHTSVQLLKTLDMLYLSNHAI